MVPIFATTAVLHTAGQQLGFAVAADQLAAMQVQAQRADRKRLIDAIKHHQSGNAADQQLAAATAAGIGIYRVVAGAAMLPLQPSPPYKLLQQSKRRANRRNPRRPLLSLSPSRRETPAGNCF